MGEREQSASESNHSSSQNDRIWRRSLERIDERISKLSRRQLLATTGLGAVGVWLLDPGRFDFRTVEGPQPATGDWICEGRTPARTGYAPEATPPTSDFSTVWSVDVPRPGSTSGGNAVGISVVDGRGFAATSAQLAAVDLQTQSLLWTYGKVSRDRRSETGERHHSVGGPPAVIGDTVIAPFGGELHAVNATGGELRWRYRDADGPMVPLGNAVARRGKYRPAAVAPRHGSTMWSGSLFDPGRPLTAHDGALLFQGEGSRDRFWLVDIETGNRRWESTLSVTGTHDIRPAMTDEWIVFRDQSLVAASADTGETKWEQPLGAIDPDSFLRSNFTYHPATDGSLVYVQASETEYAAFDLASGEQVWSAETGPVSGQRPAVTDEAVYAHTRGEVIVLDKETGERLGTFGADELSALALVEDRIYVVSYSSFRVIE